MNEVKITALPTPPSTSDSSSFDERADTFLSALPQFAEELNEFGKNIGNETQERIESTIKESINARLDENDVRLKKELVAEVASQTSGLKRRSVRLLEVPCVASTSDNYAILDEKCVAYQLVTRQNDELHDNEIVEYGDVIVPVIENNIYQWQTRLSLPRYVKEFEGWINNTTEGRGGIYLDVAAHKDEASKTIDVIEGDEYKDTQAGVNTFAISCSVGYVTYLYDNDKKTAEYTYRAALLNEDRTDVIVLTINGVVSYINVNIKKRTHNFSEDELNKPLNFKNLVTSGAAWLCHCDEMKDSVLWFGTYGTLVSCFRSRSANWNMLGFQNGFKFTFPCNVAKILYKTVPFVILEDGSVWTMGVQAKGECGVGNTTELIRFTKNPALYNIENIYSNGVNFFALTKDKKLLAWGTNSNGSLGIANATAQLSPVSVDISMFPAAIKDIACGNTFTHILLEDGTVWRAGAADTYIPYTASAIFTQMSYQMRQWDTRNVRDSVKKVWTARYGSVLTGEALPYENITKIWATQNTWAMQCESGELCFGGDNGCFRGSAHIQGSADAYAPLPSIKYEQNFGDIEDVRLLASSVLPDRICLITRKKNDTRFYSQSWGFGTPVYQSLGEFGGGDLSYDYKWVDLGLNADELVDMSCFGYGTNLFDMMIVVKNKMGDDLYHWTNNKGFAKIAY